MCQKLDTTLYHGTVSEISAVNVSLGRSRKDFGKGFYMAMSKRQAIGMMHKKYREAVRRSKNKQENDFVERLYEIELDKEILLNLNVKVFQSADIEWISFVLMCRELGGVPHDYDVVIGPTADDDTALCLKSYWEGMYGIIDSDEAKNTLLKNLEADNLGVQMFVGKQEIADKLIKSIKLIDWR